MTSLYKTSTHPLLQFRVVGSWSLTQQRVRGGVDPGQVSRANTEMHLSIHTNSKLPINL